jgi:hypothetical protein
MFSSEETDGILGGFLVEHVCPKTDTTHTAEPFCIGSPVSASRLK